MCVEDLKCVFANQFELHNYHVILYVLQIRVVCIERLSRINWVTTQHILHLLLMLALDQQLVPVVRFLVNPIEVLSILNGHKFWNAALLQDFLSSLSHLFIEHFLLVRAANTVQLIALIVLQALRLQDISCLVELVVVSTLVRYSAFG